MSGTSINGAGNSGQVKWSKDLAQQLDAKDGKKDGKISASVWNTYLDRMGSNGNRINNYITVDNAIRSFDYYERKKDKGTVTWNNWQSGLNDNPGVEDKPDTPPVTEPKPHIEEPSAPDDSSKTDAPVGNYDDEVNKREQYKPDGFIDKVSQGSSGDCWLVAGLTSLSETKWGRQAIKNAMQINPDTGDIKITLKGAYGKKKVFTVTAAELEQASKSGKYSRGDKDVLAFEIAIEKYRKQFGETLDGGLEEEVFRLITGSRNTQIISGKDTMRSLIQKAKANPEKYVISANFNLGKGAGMHEYHAYNISRFEKGDDGVNYVILTNPWASNREIRMTEEEFIQRAYEIQTLANPGISTPATHSNADGKIGNSKASSKNFDKNVASGIYAVANSNPEVIKDSIKVNSNGSVTVTLKGVGKTYTITAKDLDKARDSGNYTQGDDDVLALEIAIERYGQETIFGNISIDDEAGLDAGAVRAGTNIYTISDSRAIFLLTGQDNMFASLDNDGKYIISDTPQYRGVKIDPNLLADLIKSNEA